MEHVKNSFESITQCIRRMRVNYDEQANNGCFNDPNENITEYIESLKNKPEAIQSFFEHKSKALDEFSQAILLSLYYIAEDFISLEGVYDDSSYQLEPNLYPFINLSDLINEHVNLEQIIQHNPNATHSIGALTNIKNLLHTDYYGRFINKEISLDKFNRDIHALEAFKINAIEYAKSPQSKIDELSNLSQHADLLYVLTDHPELYDHAPERYLSFLHLSSFSHQLNNLQIGKNVAQNINDIYLAHPQRLTTKQYEELATNVISRLSDAHLDPDTADDLIHFMHFHLTYHTDTPISEGSGIAYLANQATKANYNPLYLFNDPSILDNEQIDFNTPQPNLDNASLAEYLSDFINPNNEDLKVVNKFILNIIQKQTSPKQSKWKNKSIPNELTL